MVDLAREEWIEKANIFIEEIKNFMETDAGKDMIESDFKLKLMMEQFLKSVGVN